MGKNLTKCSKNILVNNADSSKTKQTNGLQKRAGKAAALASRHQGRSLTLDELQRIKVQLIRGDYRADVDDSSVLP